MKDKTNPYVRINLYRSLGCEFKTAVSMKNISECLQIPIEIVREDMLTLCWSGFDFVMCPIIDSDDDKTSIEEYKLVERDNDEPVDSDLEKTIIDEFRSDSKISTSMQNLIKKGCMDSFQMIDFVPKLPNRVFLSLTPSEYAWMNFFMESHNDNDVDVGNRKSCNSENNIVRIKNEFQYICYDDAVPVQQIRIEEDMVADATDSHNNRNVCINDTKHREMEDKLRIKERELRNHEHQFQDMVRTEKICKITYQSMNERKSVICRPLCVMYEINSVEAAIAVLIFTESGYQFIKMEQIEEIEDYSAFPIDSKIDDFLKEKTGKTDIYGALAVLKKEMDEWLPHQWGFCNYKTQEEKNQDSCNVIVKFFDHGNVFEKIQKDLKKRKGSLERITEVYNDESGNQCTREVMIYKGFVIGKEAFLFWLRSYGASALLVETDETCDITLKDRMKEEFEKIKKLYVV